MATRSQRRKEKKRRKRKKEQQRKRQVGLQRRGRQPPVGDARHLRRISQQRPQAWPGECPEDVAVFDDAVRDRLAGELAGQVKAVRVDGALSIKVFQDVQAATSLQLPHTLIL